jgi:tRNA (mo5U34)-methyltransferase
VGLCRLAREVSAVDGHLMNVVKTIVRTNFYGFKPTVFHYDVERLAEIGFEVDAVHSIGVFYHLRDPVPHLVQLAKLVRTGVFIDTVVAAPENATETMVVDGESYRYQRYEEPQGPQAVLAGLYDHAKIMQVDDIVRVLGAAGFGQVKAFEPVWERGKLKCTIAARHEPSEAWDAMGPRQTMLVPFNA